MNNHYTTIGDVVNKYRRNRLKSPRIMHEFTMMMYLSCVMMMSGSSIVMGFNNAHHGSFQNRICEQRRDYFYTEHASIFSRNKLTLHSSSLSDDDDADGDDMDDNGRKYGNRRRTPNRQGKQRGLKGKRFQLTKTERKTLRDNQRLQSKKEGDDDDAGDGTSSFSSTTTPKRKTSSTASNQRVKMKKMTSSSTLLPPPSILSSSFRSNDNDNYDDSITSATPGDRWVKVSSSSQRNKRVRGGRRRPTTSSNSSFSQGWTNKNTLSQSSSSSGSNSSKEEGVSTSSSTSSAGKQQRPTRSAATSSSSSSSSSSTEKRIQSTTTGRTRNERQKKEFDYLPPPPSSSSSKVTGGKQRSSMDLPQWGEMFNSTYNDVSLLADLEFPSSPAIDGVLPVSELFYRSTQSISGDDDMNEESSTGGSSSSNSADSADNNGSGGDNTKKSRQEQYSGDDEELPFSAEQSDRLSTPGNKIQIRRNNANVYLDGVPSGISDAVRRELTNMAAQEMEEQRRLELRMQENLSNGSLGNKDVAATDPTTTNGDETSPTTRGTKSRTTRKNKSGTNSGRVAGRKMVRRGMEMLVGGEPINADPPQRSLELNYYHKHPKLWPRSITTNSPDFGPLMHMHSAGKVPRESVGLYCENFVDIAQKWNICPDDLKIVVSEHEVRRRNIEAAAEHAAAVDAREQRALPSVSDEDIDTLMASLSDSSSADIAGLEVDVDEGIIKDGSGRIVKFNPRELNAPKGFGATQSKKRTVRDSRGGGSGIVSDKSLSPVHTLGSGRSDDNDSGTAEDGDEDDKMMFTLGGELKFSLGVTRTELESGHGGHGHGSAFRRVLREGIGASINAKEMGFDVHISKLVMVDVEGGSTDVMVQFQLDPRDAMDIGEAERAAKEVNGALASAMNDGKMAMSLAHVAREEKGWTAKIRDRIVEEFLFETEDDDEDKSFDEGAGQTEVDDVEDDESEFDEYDDEEEEYDGPFGMEGDIIYAKDDIWLGGGNGGVFFDYSEGNAKNSPYQGKLGPYLVDAAVDRARQNQPKVIAIGDVHGCIDELQALLRKCDYHPGDLVVFLGDLVCKGPDSLSVVQMAREIGAIGVRGNHDFEVVRWHQAIKSGADPPVIGSEHYYVASALSTADLKWMYSLPWFISSSHLNALFVHAGFVSGIRLAKQNPRLMMNMRSILPDGTVTSKFFNNWPWARLWDGPQTVFFGHDADRGLQQYEHAIGLDTGCVYGGKLTACILPERRLVSVNAKREYFQYRRKHFD
jgi:hypothetical protein